TIYWLTWGGSSGKRIDTIAAVAGTPSDTVRHYDVLVHDERNLYADYTEIGGEVRKNYPEIVENETWHDGGLGVGKVSITFPISDLFPNKPARAFVKLQDFGASITTNAHNLALSINNAATKYDSGFINKYQGKVLQANFTSSALKNGNNTVDLHSFTVAGNSVNTVIRDWFELEYPRYLKTTTDSINFAFNNLATSTVGLLVVTGLTSNSYALYRFIAQDSSIAKITNFTRSNDTLRFADSVKNGTYYFLLKEDKIPAPLFFYKKKFVNLRDQTRQADYIAITHPVFITAATAYISFVSSEYDISTSLINVDDIYDEFNFGFFGAEPIREFLKLTHTSWQLPKPKYVFLIGKGTYDFYGYKTKFFGAPKVPNFIPSYGNPVSDIWFVLWDSTGALIPQMNIGRLPVKSVEEFQAYALKHQKYVLKGYDDWNKRYLFFAGGNFTDPNQIAQSKGVNDFIITNYITKPPIGGNVANFYKTTNPVTNFGPYTPEHIKDAIDQGGVFISYIGHSGTQTWDNSITDISQLANIRDRNPMISDFGCSTAKFAEPDIQSFSELAVSGLKGQAISYIGNSSLGFTSTAFSFPQVFYKKLLVDTSASLGDVHRLAKIDYMKQFGTSGSYGLFIKTNTLIGDPIIQLPIPTKPNYSVSNSTPVLSPEFPTDQSDSVTLAMKYFNFGAVIGDSVTLSVRDDYQGNVHYWKRIRRAVPLYLDSIHVVIPVKGFPGEHVLTVSLDSSNAVDELSESDNIFTGKLLVATTTIRNLTESELLNQSDGTVSFLNPTVRPLLPHFFIDVSTVPLFTQKETYQIPYDTFATSVTLDQKYQGKRIWIKSKYAETTGEGLAYSYRVGGKSNFLLNDSVAFNELLMQKVGVHQNILRMDSTRVTFSAISAGFNDGNTAVLSKNGQNFVPENTLRGHHVVLFDATTYQHIGYYRFDIFAGAAIATNYKNFLDTLSSRYIVAIGISDEGFQNLSAALKTSIKTLGSKFIDSLKFRGSWAIIGRKGAAPGSVPEQFSHPFNGRVLIDTTIVIPDTIGTFITPSFGPVSRWKNIELSYSNPPGGKIALSIVGMNDSGVDTLSDILVTDSLINLSSINADQYPAIKLVGTLTANASKVSPSVASIAINYDALAEIGTNYQTVKVQRLTSGNVAGEMAMLDTVLQGEKVRLTFRVYNAGGSTVRNIVTQINAVWENNTNEVVGSFVIDSLVPKSYKELSATYSTELGFGKRNFQFTIDPDTIVEEFYRDNNFYQFPIIVKKNENSPLLPNLVISQSGIVPQAGSFSDQLDTLGFLIHYENTGTLINDSVMISVKHLYKNSLSAQWTIRRKYPALGDTFFVSVPILKRAGEHQLQVELDPVGLIVESSESDNVAAYYFTVTTTAFTIIQPTQFSTSAVSHIIFLNPTAGAAIGQRTALLELDTVVSFSTRQSIQLLMQEFTTSYNISSLQKRKRYYWRIKEQNLPNDWTAGSFYLGDSGTFSLGQIDSTAWTLNTFTRTLFSPDSGARIVDTKFRIEAFSAGFNDGNNGSIKVNGANIISSVFGNGFNIIVLDTLNYQFVMQRRFNISGDPNEADSLVQFIGSIPAGLHVVGVIVDDGGNNLTTAARNALKTIGSGSIDQLSFRDSWAIIGRKGAPIGSVPEVYKAQGSGAASVETTFVRKENTGTIVTPTFSSFAQLTNLVLNGVIPSSSQLVTKVLGITPSGTVDTVIFSQNQLSIPLSSFNTVTYPSARIMFNLSAASSHSSPRLYGWSITGSQPIELAASANSTSLSADSVLEGESIQYSTRIYNLSAVAAESVVVRLSTTQSGLATIMKEEIVPLIAAQDSILFTYTYDSRGRRGNRAFVVEVDPDNTEIEVNENNNSVTVPFFVLSDSIKPRLQIAFDGMQIVNGDYVSQRPEIRVLYSDNNPASLLQADTSNFTIKLNGRRESFTSGTAELVNTSTPGRAEIRWTPTLDDGDNFIEIYALDIAGNISDTMNVVVKVASEFRLLDVYTIPNPFNRSTHFTFNLAGPVMPEEVIIKVYTVAGRLIHEIRHPAIIGFNKIYWDGRDMDGDEIGNGVYLYRVVVTHEEKQATATQKLVKMR
ncbi:MAG: hypothetical protein HYV29_03780, partial [Ignavibacteriales bacterium]|nr:hypothetical protein [Ignavibacteriales bacterium]